MTEADQVLPSVVTALNEPFFMDVKLTIVKRIMSKMRFIHVDQLITKITLLVREACTPNGILLCNINPFMVTASILSLGVEIKNIFPLTRHRIDKYEEDLRERVAGLLDNCYQPILIEKLLN